MIVLRRIAILVSAAVAALAVLTGVGTAAPASTPVDIAVDVGDKAGCWDKHYYNVWKAAPAYDAPGGKQVGTLTAGPNRYFYFQRNYPNNKVVVAQYWNTYWSMTDIPGRAGVWVSVVYITAGNNGQPVPGLPIC